MPPKLSVRLPRTETRRGAHSFVILIDRVSLDPHIAHSLAWEGTHYRTGALVDAARLQEGSLVLEHTEAIDSNTAGPRRYWRLMLILWRYSAATIDPWTEVSRVMAPASHAALELRQLAARILAQDPWREGETIAAVAERICALIDAELRLHGGSVRAQVLDLILNFLVSRLVDERGEVELPSRRPPMRIRAASNERRKVAVIEQ